MSIYIHEGQGHYIGSVCVVEADTQDKAESLVRGYLDEAGLDEEALDVRRHACASNDIIYCCNGDY